MMIVPVVPMMTIPIVAGVAVFAVVVSVFYLLVSLIVVDNNDSNTDCLILFTTPCTHQCGRSTAHRVVHVDIPGE